MPALGSHLPTQSPSSTGRCLLPIQGHHPGDSSSTALASSPGYAQPDGQGAGQLSMISHTRAPWKIPGVEANQSLMLGV